MRLIGQVAWIGRDNAVALKSASEAFKLSPGDVVRFCVSGDEACNMVREGEHLVDRVEYDAGVVHMRRPARITTPSATELDWLFAYARDAKLDDRGIGVCQCGRSRESGVHAEGAKNGHAFEQWNPSRDEHVEDHAALVNYLLSAVRRADWHAVSDAANDLRVLEARHGKP